MVSSSGARKRPLVIRDCNAWPRCFSTGAEKKIEEPTKEPVAGEEGYSYRKSEYATAWEDPIFPEWQQFKELNSTRMYYHNRKDGTVSWTHPSNPDPSFDIIAYERELNAQPLTQVPENTPPGSLLKRFGAGMIDIVVSTGAGCVFALGVWIDLQEFQTALPSIGFSAWVAFVARDMVFEQGTRSVGKRLMKLEVVTSEGRLPSRYNTFFRQVYLPVYAGSALLMPYIFILPVAEVGCVLFTKNHLRLGDLLGRTRVIPELPDREARLKEKKKVDEEEALKD